MRFTFLAELKPGDYMRAKGRSLALLGMTQSVHGLEKSRFSAQMNGPGITPQG